MSDELAGKLLEKLPPIQLEPAEADFGKAPQTNAIEAHLLGLSTLSMDEETEGLREVLHALEKV
jgi:hypothetical protein